MMRSGRPVGRGPPGELRQCAVDFHRRSVHLDRADGTPKFRGQVIRFEHPQERAFRVRVRDDCLRVNRSSPFEPDACRASSPNANPLDRRAEKDFHAVGACGSREGIGQCAHPAQHEPPATDLAVDVPEEVVRERERGPWRRGSGEMTDYALVREGGFDLIRLEIFIEEFFRAVEEQAPEEVLRFRAAEKRDQVSDRDGRGEEHRFDEVVDLGPHRLVLRIRRRVFLRELRDFLRGLLAAGPEEKRSSIGERAEALWVEGHLPQPELRELEILDDLRAEESRHVSRSADLESRRDLVRDARASDTVCTLDNDDAEPRFGEIVRGDEPVMARPDDDDVRRGHPQPGITSTPMAVSSCRPDTTANCLSVWY